MNIRDQRISTELQILRQQSNLEVVDCEIDGITREDLWVVWVRGKQKTIWQEAYYPVQITFPQNYPIDAPRITFPQDFKHVHVYEGGLICLPILEKQYWQPKLSMKDLITRIHSLIHQDINPYSPANHTIFKLLQTEPDQYTKLIEQQAKKYSKKISKYYECACIHIDINE